MQRMINNMAGRMSQDYDVDCDHTSLGNKDSGLYTSVTFLREKVLVSDIEKPSS